jgi:putative thioredoxin
VLTVGDADFEVEVLERSSRVPVLVDFWAPWCGPCQTLGPILERLAEEAAGAFVLAKVNTDESPALAEAFQVRSIPFVVLLVGGQPVDAFVGALAEARIREFLRPHLRAAEPPAGDDLEEARGLLERGHAQAAASRLEPLAAAKPEDPAVRLLAARAAFTTGDEDAVRRHVEAIEEGAAERGPALLLLEALALREGCGPGEDAWRRRLAADPEDLDARYGLGCCLALGGRHAEALEALVAVVAQDRRHRDGAARKAMLAVFGILGPGSDLAREYRQRLSLHL